MFDSRLPALALALALLPPAAAAAPKTIKVDCTKGDSIQSALSKNGDPLTIEISGICVENVTVRRDNVHFLGSDPTLDGFQAASATEPFDAAVVVRGSRNLVFENLQFSGGTTSGLRIENARRNIDAINCIFENNGTWGVIAVGGTITLDGAIVRNNHTSTNGGGITAAESGQIFCDNCTIQDNPNGTDGSGATAQNGGVISIANSLIDGVRSGGTATNNGRLIIVQSDVTGDTISLGASRSDVIVDTASLGGRLSISNKSRVQLIDVLQSSVGTSAIVSGDSYFEVFASGSGTAAFTAPVTITNFSEGRSFGDVSYDQIFCSTAGEFACDGLESKAGSTCGLCP